MVDFFLEEIEALEETFPDIFFLTDTQVILCNFHREQAWDRWCKKYGNGVSGCKDEVLKLLRAIADADTLADLTAAKNALLSSQVWEDNPRLQECLNSRWLDE